MSCDICSLHPPVSSPACWPVFSALRSTRYRHSPSPFVPLVAVHRCICVWVRLPFPAWRCILPFSCYRRGTPTLGSPQSRILATHLNLCALFYRTLLFSPYEEFLALTLLYSAGFEEQEEFRAAVLPLRRALLREFALLPTPRGAADAKPDAAARAILYGCGGSGSQPLQHAGAELVRANACAARMMNEWCLALGSSHSAATAAAAVGDWVAQLSSREQPTALPRPPPHARAAEDADAARQEVLLRMRTMAH